MGEAQGWRNSEREGMKEVPKAALIPHVFSNASVHWIPVCTVDSPHWEGDSRKAKKQAE